MHPMSSQVADTNNFAKKRLGKLEQDVSGVAATAEGAAADVGKLEQAVSGVAATAEGAAADVAHQGGQVCAWA